MRAAEPRGTLLHLTFYRRLDNIQHLQIRIHPVGPYIDHKRTDIRDNIMLYTGIDLSHRHFDWAEIGRNFGEPVGAEPLDVRQSRINGIDPFLPGRMAALSFGGTVENHQTLLSYSHLHLRRLAHNAEIYASQFGKNQLDTALPADLLLSCRGPDQPIGLRP